MRGGGSCQRKSGMQMRTLKLKRSSKKSYWPSEKKLKELGLWFYIVAGGGWDSIVDESAENA
jgi:hypothetical protein